MVFQNYALYPHMTVRDNMAFSADAGEAAARRRSTSACARPPTSSGLDDLLDRYPRQLSGGQRQRVAMGRGIVRDPQVFLFDEPLSNLDAKLRVQMRTEIKELHQRLKTTSIYVTHDQIEAMTMADKIVVMRDGRVEQTGSPLELYDHPVEPVRRRLHRLAGDELPARRAAARGGDARVEFGDGVSLPAPPRPPRGSDGQPVVYGTRPEHLQLADGDDGIAAEVVVVEPTGADTQVVRQASPASRSPACSASATTSAPGEHDPPAARPGARPPVRCRAAACAWPH